jgi:hypothetical protein
MGAKGDAGQNAIVGLLTNESVTLQANNAGVVSSFTPANGEFWVYNGTTKVTSGITFSKVSETGCTAAINSSGAYSVSAMSADNATVVLRAVYGGVTIDKVLTLSKSRAGADGHSPYIDETTNTWWTWDEELGIYTDTGYSPVGSDGAIPYPAGYYDNTKWYRREAGYAPYVQYGGTLYLLIKDTPNAGIPTTNTEYWKAFNNWQAVFVDSLVAPFAKIGGAVFTGDTTGTSIGIRGRLISERGVDGTVNFHNYTGDSGSWQPKLMLDFLNGAAKVGDFTIEESGRIVMVDPATGTHRLVFGVQNLPSISSLVNNTTDGGGPASVGSGTLSLPGSQVLLSGSINVGRDGSTLTYNASSFQTTVYMYYGGQATGRAFLELYRNGVFYTTLSFLEVQLVAGESATDTKAVSVSVPVMQGTYTVVLRLQDLYADAADASVSAGTLSWSWTAAGIRQQQYGLDGMMFFYSDHHFHFTEGGGLDGRALPDKWNAPGVLLSATVLATGGFTSWWGAKKHSTNTATKNSTGRYTVYHSVGHSNYQITATPTTANRSCHIVSRGNNNFVIEWRTIGSSPALSDTGFDFQITGNNY